ncbi:Soluble lytic murein transglycosylase precursor [hydrothermal vent metagenome]|uniref:Soluble lytic murein transglycosylase n=1 Tax=hydrothermal vent metagenome TaxID=652676 RepID=A0A3B1DYA3_9ZZZZ
MLYFYMLGFSIYLTVIIICFPQPAFSEIYKYVDSKGIENFTDRPTQNNAELIIKEKKTPVTPSVNNTTTYSSNNSLEKYKVLAEKTAKRYALDPDLVKAVIEIESGWNPRAVSSSGAIGLMQLMPDTAMDMGVGNPYDPEENIEGGVKYLKRLVDKFGDIRLALAAYNAGPSVVKRYGSVPPYTETLLYVQDILFKYNNNNGKPLKRIRQNHRKGKEHIYKVVFKDGHILYTNTPVYLKRLSSF